MGMEGSQALCGRRVILEKEMEEFECFLGTIQSEHDLYIQSPMPIECIFRLRGHLRAALSEESQFLAQVESSKCCVTLSDVRRLKAPSKSGTSELCHFNRMRIAWCPRSKGAYQVCHVLYRRPMATLTKASLFRVRDAF